ncbi:uncharacterized protein LOC112511964 [Cynara cardunculus var. scolymus]|nr:uncharacterized protein LOC112511964 [Cynara cardunculus var. scolymus]
MEANVCDVNHLDSDVLLPPRKRLLACLKKQNGDGNGNSYSPSTCSSLNELDARISFLLRAHLSNANPSQEEIVTASRSAAEVAVKVAMAARATAEEKAVIAAKAMAAAKKALEFVASFDNQEISSSAEQQLKKNKTKKQVEVQMLYNNKKPRLENGKSKTNDEELARQLHQAINSSPRISKCGLPSDVKSHKHKKLKISSENGRINNGSIVGEGISPSSNGASKPLEMVTSIGKEVENASKSKMENGNAERIQSKAKCSEEDTTILGRKRGRMKQKKLPLSICHDRDQATPKEDRTSRSSFSVGSSANGAMAVERNSSWKCQAFKAPACVKQNKVMQL